MSNLLKFPPRGFFVTAVCVERESDGEGWFVLTHGREHGWLHGDFAAALRDAQSIAADFGVSVISSAGRCG
jgi:hypothetical protein